MNILDKIIETKKIEVERNKELCPVAELEKSMFFNRKTLSLKKFLEDPAKTGIIAEFKRQSPSKGVINGNVTVQQVTQGYEKAGASAVSILTDKDYFGGENKDVIEGRTFLNIPILRKEFIIDEYQIIEAKSIGADVILLIAACLEPARLRKLAEFAKYLGLEVLMEVHNEKELLDNCCEVDVIGVNNRNLKDFSVSIETSIKLAELIPGRYLKISESGIYDAATIIKLKEQGYHGFLIGENFMRKENPAQEIENFVASIKKLEAEHKRIKPV
jgi:indole-3-glycerol phosphate synthase